MSQIIVVSDESASLLKQEAEARGLSIDAWVDALAHAGGSTRDLSVAARTESARAPKENVADPEGPTVREFIRHARA